MRDPLNLAAVAEPVYDDHEENFTWAGDLDDAIATARQADERFDTLLRTVENGDLSIVNLRSRTPDGYLCPLLTLSRNGGDEDYIIITTAEEPDAWTAGEQIAEKMTVCRYETHRTPSWTFRITCHA